MLRLLPVNVASGVSMDIKRTRTLRGMLIFAEYPAVVELFEEMVSQSVIWRVRH